MKENVGVVEGGAFDSSCRDSSLVAVAVAVAVADGAMVWGYGGLSQCLSTLRCALASGWFVRLMLVMPLTLPRQVALAGASTC